jgi:hypothetical protein
MAYGETRRTWDWFEFDATVNPPRLYLKNGIPLRKGDVLIVYSNDPVPVLDYDPSTRTVIVPRSPWNRTGERVGFPRTTLLLMTYCIDVLKHGANNVHLRCWNWFHLRWDISHTITSFHAFGKRLRRQPNESDFQILW